MTEPRASPAFEWAIASKPLAGETAIGDVAVVAEEGADFLLAAIDGLGHGAEAALASAAAAAAVLANAAEPLENLLVLCHEKLQSTRGAAITLARLETRAAVLSWVGVGNVDAYLIRNTPTGVAPVDSPVLSGGIVGFDLPRVWVRSVDLNRGDLVILATDGVDRRFVDDLRFGMDVSALAEQILATSGKGTDDALVLVSRFRGGDG